MEDIISAYLACVKENKRLPTYSDLHNKGITKSKIKSQHVNLENLHNYVEENHLDQITKYITHENDIFSKRKLTDIKGEIKGIKRFFITTAVTEKSVDDNFYNSIKNYCKRNNAKLLLLPCADMWSRKSSARWTFDKKLEDEIFVHSELALNKNLFLSSIKISAKQIKPTTGLNRIGQRNGSYVFASPKQFLEYVITSPESERLPHAIMTPGALTVPNYQTDRYMSERLSYIAENDHVMGGIIVEIQDSRTFHFRQCQADHDGSFIDLGVKYNSDGTIEDAHAYFILGDYHVGKTDPVVKKCISDICSKIKIKDIFVHDFYDGYSISHWDINFPLKMAKKAMDNNNSLLDEIRLGGKEANWLLSLTKGNLIMVKGNHDEFLERYLVKGTYVNDPINHYVSLELAKAYLDGEMPLKYAYEKHGNINDFERIIWLERDEEFKIGGVECGQHGDLGLNGSKASLMSLERSYGASITGHTHSAAILRLVFRVGTSTVLRTDYNRGPSSWTQTSCLCYENGSRQLINFVRGKYTI